MYIDNENTKIGVRNVVFVHKKIFFSLLNIVSSCTTIHYFLVIGIIINIKKQYYYHLRENKVTIITISSSISFSCNY